MALGSPEFARDRDGSRVQLFVCEVATRVGRLKHVLVSGMSRTGTFGKVRSEGR
jgi:hypothetical protein